MVVCERRHVCFGPQVLDRLLWGLQRRRELRVRVRLRGWSASPLLLQPQGMGLRLRDGRFAIFTHQMPHPYLRELLARDELLVLNPYFIASVFAIAAGSVEISAGGRLLPVALLVALIAGWSSAWSP